MCGIAGLWAPQQQRWDLRQTTRRMTDTMHHRGPDAQGEWADPNSGIAFGHCRLSVLDLSPEGAQPMRSSSGRYVIAFNGEIYNFIELRNDLIQRGVTFRGNSDTEVMLATIEQWGIEGAIQQFAGMFAFAAWDYIDQTLYLVRDRFGEKPLYYGSVSGIFLFGSELKALRAHPDWKAEIDRDALATFFNRSYVPAPNSIYRGIQKVLPGCIVKVRRNASMLQIQQFHYWSLERIVEAGCVNPSNGDDREIVDAFEACLRRTIRQEMVADVPLGAFLSGGLDSSTIVALMQIESNRPVQTFTIGFNETGYDEAEYARQVADHLGTDHTELYVTAKDMIDVLPQIPMLYDEPFADASQIPTYLVAQLARRSVTVSLSGDGGDELFGGYNRYLLGERLWKYACRVPVSWRTAVAHCIKAVPPVRWDTMFQALSSFVPALVKVATPGDKLHKLAAVITMQTPEALYDQLTSNVYQGDAIMLDGTDLLTDALPRKSTKALQDFVQRSMFLDELTSLPDGILVKVDRATMGVSLESRAPFLDHRIAEFAWQLPRSMKVRHGHGKWILRQLLNRYIPKQLIDRPKMGFRVPIGRWLRTSLREWADDLLEPAQIRRQGFLNEKVVAEKWIAHQSGSQNCEDLLWNILMFQAWLKMYVHPFEHGNK